MKSVKNTTQTVHDHLQECLLAGMCKFRVSAEVNAGHYIELSC